MNMWMALLPKERPKLAPMEDSIYWSIDGKMTKSQIAKKTGLMEVQVKSGLTRLRRLKVVECQEVEPNKFLWWRK